ncbi:MAG: hypothetical protein JOZ16_16995 [Methylobacteriaceae bacterium]|nr:hypothetical protein [Methylobacteriaceae bacterium]
MDIETGQAERQDIRPTLTPDLIVKNFAVATALLSLAIAAISSAFMFGYFAAFDNVSSYHLTQFLQYSDVLQFAFNISQQMFLIFCGFGLLTAELSRRLNQPLAPIDAQTIVTAIITPLAVWFMLAANKYELSSAFIFFVGMIILIPVISLNMARPQHALHLHRLIPSLCFFLLGFAFLGLYFGGAARNQRHFSVLLNGESQPRTLHLITSLSRGYLFFDAGNQHIIFVPDKEVKMIDHEPQH